MQLFILVLVSLGLSVCGSSRPNIIFIIADDLGWNDVGFHGSGQIPTPNIDALAYSGVILQDYYVAPICTPSRSALMTGKYPIHTGMQHTVIYGAEPRGLPLSEKILPQYLKDLGYKTHLVGKWHLGSCRKEYLPLNRGFDSHIGFWTGKIDYYDHTNMEHGYWGHDFRRDYNIAYDLYGQYATDIYSNEAVKVIRDHNSSEPLFLMIGHSAVHSGNPYTPLRAPDKIVDSFVNITNFSRKIFAGMLTKLDESVGIVVEALQQADLLNNSIIIFSTDNGGPAAGFNSNAASNFPLRGVKNTLWEGGVRGVGLIWSPLFKQRSRVAAQRMHIADWLPTLYTAAGGITNVFKNIDGLNLWESLSEDLPSQRTRVVHNIDDILGSASMTDGIWKVHKGTNYNGTWDNWYGPSGHDCPYNIDSVYSSRTGKAVQAMTSMPDQSEILKLRDKATLKCKMTTTNIPCEPLRAPCLFNIQDDPCELKNLAKQEPEVLANMLSLLAEVNGTAVPPNNKPDDPHGNPKYWSHVFTNFLDFELTRFT